MINLNGVDLNFNLSDADFYELYMENAANLDGIMNIEPGKEEENDYKKMSLLIRKKCDAVKTFLDNLFGEGTGSEVCGKNSDINICVNVYWDIIIGVRKEQNENEKRLKNKMSNRAQLRDAKKR